MVSDIPSPGSPKPFTGLPTCTDLPVDPDNTLQLGYFFTSKSYSRLTPQHGFIAELQIPIPGFLSEEFFNTRDSDIISDATRFDKVKQESHKHQRVPVRCLIDESTSHTFALYSVVGIDEDAVFDEAEQLDWQLSIDNVFIPGSVLLGVTDIYLLIHGRAYFLSTWVVHELFPGHEGVDIQIVLGRDFLRSCPGLVLKPVIRGRDSIDLVPWDYDTGGQDFDINSEGELIVYVCGHSELQTEDPKSIKQEKGGFGVFFGPDSNYNVSMRCTLEGSPQDEIALIEGIICVALITILGRCADGPFVFTSVRIRAHAQGVFSIIGSKRILQDYQDRGWEDDNGKLISLWEILQIWAESVVPELEAGKPPWMKGDMIVFEQVGKREGGVRAAHHLAISSFASCMAEEVDRGARKATSVELADSLFTYIELLSWFSTNPGTRHYKLVRHPDEHSFIMNRKVASKKASGVGEPSHSQVMQITMNQFFPPKGVINTYTFWQSLEKTQLRTAGEIFAISDQNFIEQVIEIGKKRGRLMGNVRWVGIEGYKLQSDMWNGGASKDESATPSGSGING